MRRSPPSLASCEPLRQCEPAHLSRAARGCVVSTSPRRRLGRRGPRRGPRRPDSSSATGQPAYEDVASPARRPARCRQRAHARLWGSLTARRPLPGADSAQRFDWWPARADGRTHVSAAAVRVCDPDHRARGGHDSDRRVLARDPGGRARGSDADHPPPCLLARDRPAVSSYEAAVAAAERGGERTVLAEALRRLAVVRRHRSEVAAATALCQQSYEVARQSGDDLLAAEALNTLGGLYLSAGAPDDARRVFLEALELGGSNREVRARVEQNLGILANIRGELHEAIARYERSLDAYRDCGDDHGCALAYHNLGMVSADRGWLNAADCYFRESRALAERVGDAYLRGLCLVNHAEDA